MTWTIDTIASQAGKTFLVTGANTGLGYTTAETLAAKDARVLLACRSEEKGGEAVAKIKRKHPAADVALGIVDLGSLASVRDFAAHVTEQEARLDVLINNAGVGTPPRGFTTDGFEQQFGINFLASFYRIWVCIIRLGEPGFRFFSYGDSHELLGINLAIITPLLARTFIDAWSRSKVTCGFQEFFSQHFFRLLSIS